MHTLLRITLLSVFAALGIGVAIAVAMQKPADHPLSKPLADSPPSTSSKALLAAQLPAPAPVQAPYRDLVANQAEQIDETIDRVRQMAQFEKLSDALSNLQDQLAEPRTPPPTPAPAVDPLATPAAPADPVETLPATPPSGAATVNRDEGDDKLTINAKGSDIRDVLELIGSQGRLNILASKSVTGTVTASLTGVSLDTALSSILKSTGFIARREGSIVYIGTPADFQAMDQTQDRILTRVYRPNYIKSADLATLITPMLTTEVGKVTVSTASEVDVPPDQVKTGGNSYSGTDVVMVRDYEAVLREVDVIFAEVDVKPRQVAIEAMILSVKLSDVYRMGVNFEALRDKDNIRLISGTPLSALANIDVSSGGLKVGFLDSSLGVFINALETIGDTNVIASPRLTCLNKQRAEIQIGEQLGYVNTTVTQTFSTQSVSFLDVGTLLRIRPFIGNDGLIRMEVHPELSTGTVSVSAGLTLPNKQVTQVTTNVMCSDGCTAVIGGLIREDLGTTGSQIPLLGSLPWVGPAFRQKTETVSRNEIIVLITPRIISEPMLCKEGEKLGNDFTERQSIYFDKMSPIAKRNYANHYLRLSRAAYSAGDYGTALKQVNWAIHFDPLNRDATSFRGEIVAAGGFHDESIHQYLHQGLHPGAAVTSPHPDHSKHGFPWKKPEGFGGEPSMGFLDDPGAPGPARTFARPLPSMPASEISVTPPSNQPVQLPQQDLLLPIGQE